MQLDANAVQWSAPERDRAGRPLLVLMHGKGSNESDLFGLSPLLPLEPVIASVRAPLRDGPGFAWFEQSDFIGGAPSLESVDEAANAVLHWLDGLDCTSVDILGFSQGGVMVLQLLRLAPERFGRGVNLGGFVARGIHPGDAQLETLRPPVFWGRGTEDTVIGPRLIDDTLEWLPGHSRLTERIYEGLGHGVNASELQDVGEFLRGAAS
ncbi:alpha/beta hydrolase [Parafrigoribacterium soli]|uniref:alpha/beta hydrolase n=1 Tax=Parafrigoribacterium soli TaxID=3144663 RepID=UPI0032ED9FE9